ncbi:hypothetical protein BDV09DRAFT_173718 [Aspergillus tetrazonus]
MRADIVKLVPSVSAIAIAIWTPILRMKERKALTCHNRGAFVITSKFDLCRSKRNAHQAKRQHHRPLGRRVGPYLVDGRQSRNNRPRQCCRSDRVQSQAFPRHSSQRSDLFATSSRRRFANGFQTVGSGFRRS